MRKKLRQTKIFFELFSLVVRETKDILVPLRDSLLLPESIDCTSRNKWRDQQEEMLTSFASTEQTKETNKTHYRRVFRFITIASVRFFV